MPQWLRLEPTFIWAVAFRRIAWRGWHIIRTHTALLRRFSYAIGSLKCRLLPVILSVARDQDQTERRSFPQVVACHML